MARTADGHSYVCKNGPDHDGECYNWFERTGPYANIGTHFLVVAGTDFAESQADGTIILQVYLTGDTAHLIDKIVYAFTTSGASTQGMIRRMLVPPNFTVDSQGGGNRLSIVMCATIEDAIAAL